MANDIVCRDKIMAVAVIDTITQCMKAGTQKDALSSVAEWLRGKRSLDDVFKMTREERQARILELLTKERNLMSVEERRERAAFYLEGTEGEL